MAFKQVSAQISVDLVGYRQSSFPVANGIDRTINCYDYRIFSACFVKNDRSTSEEDQKKKAFKFFSRLLVGFLPGREIS
jgi:hypothetical protein